MKFIKVQVILQEVGSKMAGYIKLVINTAVLFAPLEIDRGLLMFTATLN